MSYEIINSIPQFNFQINRILTYGDLACCREEVISHVAQVKTLEEWYIAWQKIAEKSEQERRYLHAAYYYRMAEFFLKSDMPEKNTAYKKCVENVYKAFDFEKAISAVLDCFGIRRCAMVGISWGGYFALRSAAYDKRIAAAAAYDVMDNGLEVMTNIFPEPIQSAIRLSYKYHWQGVLNILVNIIRKESILADWAISQGLHITGTRTPCEFFQSISFHNLVSATELLTQDILLLAGAEDHYIPRNQFYRLKSSIHNAKSLT